MRTPRQDPPRADDKKVRLAAALKSNIARRKAQAKAREAVPDDAPDAAPDVEQTPGTSSAASPTEPQGD